MPLKNTSTVPPGGWRYEQPVTGFKLNSMSGFLDACKELLNHRRSNQLPRASINECAEDIDAATCQRIGHDPYWCIDPAQKKTGQPLWQSAANVLHAAARAINTASTGAQILLEWLGSGGKPVSQELAQARANVCINDCSDPQRQNHCYNRPPQFFQKINAAVAKAILEQRREKENLGLKVENEEKLHTCQICECHSPLKVWVPMDIIMARTKPEIFQKFPDYCWMKTEQRRKNQTLETNAVKTTEE